MMRTMLQLALRDGAVCQQTISTTKLADYFSAITELNKTAHLYGAVYYASPAALQELEDRLE